MWCKTTTCNRPANSGKGFAWKLEGGRVVSVIVMDMRVVEVKITDFEESSYFWGRKKQ